jgi:hypothetical protein
MITIWTIAKIAVYTFILVVLYRQSYNFIFFLAQRPKTWIAVVGALGVANMMLAYALGWAPRLVSAAVLTALLLNVAPSLSKEERAEVREVYKEMVLPYGRLQSRLGLAAFGLCSLVSYLVLFGESCDKNNECISIVRSLTS